MIFDPAIPEQPLGEPFGIGRALLEGQLRTVASQATAWADLVASHNDEPVSQQNRKNLVAELRHLSGVLASIADIEASV